MQINFTLPILPIPKGRPRMGKGFAYTPARTRAYENELAYMIRNAYKGEPLCGALTVKMVFFLPKPKKPKHKYPISKRSGDLDNFIKSFLDAGNGILWEDDCQIINFNPWKLFAVGAPSIQVSVQDIE
jgi:Holliday junction resolvase RusA-like endonuclease